MDMLDFEELAADMLDVTDEQREDDSFLIDKFEQTFEISFDDGYKLTKALLAHTPQVQAGLTGKVYHAFVSKNAPVMLIKAEAN
jgi:hypothetical protein